MTGRFPDPETLAICERFSLWLRQGGGLPIHGRPVPRGDAAGLDFEGFAEYAPGMDLRHLDWALYARTREFYVRTFADEGTGVLAVLLDGSGSMAVGDPPKWELARRLAAAIVFAGLREVHPVLLGIARGPRLEALPLRGGLSFAPSAFEFLGAARPEGPTDLGAAFGDLPTGRARGGAVVIGDFLDPNGPERAVRALSAAGWDVDLCRVTAPCELDLPAGGFAVHDPEGDGHRVVPHDRAERAEWAARVEAHRAALPAAARRQGALLVELTSDLSLGRALTRYFEAVGLARGGPGRR
jgi:uncharacterized protein (DUF58 family)